MPTVSCENESGAAPVILLTKPDLAPDLPAQDAGVTAIAGDVPVHVIPCIEGRTDGKPVPQQASRWGTIVPAAWSFMLAARTRGLGTCWTTFHLAHEEEAAELLGIPYEEVMQAALIPVAYTLGTEFSPARRKPLEARVDAEQLHEIQVFLAELARELVDSVSQNGDVGAG